MKRMVQGVGAALVLALAVVCATMLLVSGLFGREAAAPNTASEAEAAAPELTLNEKVLSLIGSDNTALRQFCDGRCFAEITPRGRARVTFFEPYLSVQFALEDDPAGIWRAGAAPGLQEENPFSDALRINQIELCEEIDPKAPFVERQPSLQQLFACDTMLTYDGLCAALGQTPELRHVDIAYYSIDAVLGSEDQQPKNERGNRTVGRRITGGEDRATFEVDGYLLTVGFLDQDGERPAFHAELAAK